MILAFRKLTWLSFVVFTVVSFLLVFRVFFPAEGRLANKHVPKDTFIF